MWEITKQNDVVMQLQDPDGWYSARVKWDGCVDLTRYYNEPMSHKDENIDCAHICDLPNFIKRLEALLEMTKDFAEHK